MIEQCQKPLHLTTGSLSSPVRHRCSIIWVHFLALSSHQPPLQLVINLACPQIKTLGWATSSSPLLRMPFVSPLPAEPGQMPTLLRSPFPFASYLCFHSILYLWKQTETVCFVFVIASPGVAPRPGTQWLTKQMSYFHVQNQGIKFLIMVHYLSKVGVIYTYLGNENINASLSFLSSWILLRIWWKLWTLSEVKKKKNTVYAHTKFCMQF